MNKYYVIRIAAAIFMIILIAWAPWWLIVLCSIAGLVYFRNYYEIFVWGIFVDAIYGLSPWLFNYTIGATIIFLIVFFFKHGIRGKMRDRMKV